METRCLIGALFPGVRETFLEKTLGWTLAGCVVQGFLQGLCCLNHHAPVARGQ